MKALIIDDDMMPALHLKELIKLHCFEISEVSILSNQEKILKNPNLEGIEILFLDMEMPGLSGFELLNKLNLHSNCQVVVVTAFDNYALEAYQNEAMAYLIKPVQVDDLIKVVRKVNQFSKDSLFKSNEARKIKETKKLKVYDNEEYNLVNINEIIRLEANGNYTHLYTKDKSYVSTVRLGSYEEKLENHGFFRIHRSHIINLNCLKKIGKASSSFIVLENEEVLPITSTKRNLLLKQL